MIDNLCFLAYKLCLCCLSCGKALWFMRISKSGLGIQCNTFSFDMLHTMCRKICGFTRNHIKTLQSLYNSLLMSYSWDSVLSSSWKLPTKNNFKSLHFLLYKCFLWLWETKKNKNKIMYSWCCCLDFTTICLYFWMITVVLHPLPAEHAGEFKGCPLLDQ